MRENLNSTRAWLVLGLALAMPMTGRVMASDHDDGETNIKSRNRNITDVYFFREDWQTNAGADAANMIAIMNTNPRSVPRQQYFFDHTARYEMHFTRTGDRDSKPTGVPDLTLRFTFSPPNAAGQQAITLTRVTWTNGVITSEETVPAGMTTAAVPGLGNAIANQINPVTVDGQNLTVFAGLREDPFFFDVLAFFRVRAALLGLGPMAGFADLDNSQDFARNYNVNTIVARLPIAFLQQGTGLTVFDHWDTISIPE